MNFARWSSLVLLVMALGACQETLPKQPLMSETLQAIDRLEEQHKQAPNNVQVMLSLGSTLVQAVRETADTAYYARILTLMDLVDRVEPRNAEAAALRSSVAAGYHHFADALDWADRAIEIDPKAARYHGLRADALIELGRYEEAESTLQTMVDLRPDFASYSRIAYLRELHGDLKGAIDAMELALKAGAGVPENIAWAQVQLGNLFLGKDADTAERHFQWALQRVEDYPPALRGLGMMAFAEGDDDAAENFFRTAFDMLPTTEHATDLADFYRMQGDDNEAERFEKLAFIAYKASEAGGTDIDLEFARFLSDHGSDKAEALRRARAAYAARPNVIAADTLAWALYQQDMSEDAWQYAQEALRLGTQDASVSFHAGMIALARGDQKQAKLMLQRANVRNPNFSLLHTHMLASTLAEL